MDYAHEASSMPNGRRRVALHKAHLTTRTVADASPRDHRYIVWDDELPGFGVRISPSGLRSFIVQYRACEGGRRAASRKKVLGRFPALTPARARSRAREVLRAVAGRRGNGEVGALPIPTLRHAFEGYLRSRPTVAERTRSEYRRRFERHAPQWLDRRLDELAREDVERRFLALSEHPGPSVASAFVKRLLRHFIGQRMAIPPLRPQAASDMGCALRAFRAALRALGVGRMGTSTEPGSQACRPERRWTRAAPGAILGTWRVRGLPFRTRCTAPAPPGRCSWEISRRLRGTWRACARATWLASSAGSPSSLPRSPFASRGGSGLGDGWVPGLHAARDEDGPKSDAASMALGRVRFGLAEPADRYVGLQRARLQVNDLATG